MKKSQTMWCGDIFLPSPKFFKIMKLLLILIFTGLVTFASSSYSQTTRLSMDMEQGTILQVFNEIEEQTNFKIAYNSNKLDVNSKIDLHVSNRTVNEILDIVLKSSDLEYEVVGRYIVIKDKNSDYKSFTRSDQQVITITGTVKESSGASLPGVAVVAKGTTNGTITNIDGNYSLKNVPSDGILIFSFVGMRMQEISVGGKSQIDVMMEEESIGLEEVVAVGYGTQKKASITGSIAQYNAENLEERPIQRIDQALVGQMAGVHVKQTSGMPGAGLSVQIRGTGSITANNEPLYVVDGFPLEISSQNKSGNYETGNPLDNINPNDIESVQVLKDASAAAIYGSRASNGVVLITTKKGKVGKPKISFNYYTGWNEASRQVDMLDGDQWINRAVEIMNYNYLSDDDGTQGRSTSDDYDTRMTNIGSFDRNMIPDPRWLEDGHPGITFVNWQDEIFRKGAISNYQLSASGGNDFVKYFVSADYLNQEGFVLGTDYKRYAVRANVEVKPNDKITAGINIAPSYSEKNDPGVESKDDQFHIAIGMPPLVETEVGLYANTGDLPSYT